MLSARAIATVICSCLSHERSRRCLRRCAAPEPAARLGQTAVAVFVVEWFIILREKLSSEGLTLAVVR